MSDYAKRFLHKVIRRLSPTGRELHRLRALDKNTPCSTNLLGGKLSLADAYTFFAQYDEIICKGIYKFPSDKPDPVIIDAGANIGVSVIYFKRLFPKSRVTAFEADPQVFRILEQNVAAFGLGGVTLINKAVWTSEGSLAFQSRSPTSGRLETNSDTVSPASGSIVVPTVRFHSFLNEPVDLLKMDIEGAETAVLLDCLDRLANVKNLFVEYHSFADRPQDLPELLTGLKNTGFRVEIHSAPIVMSDTPFCEQKEYQSMDMMLNIFCRRNH